jgi:uncharacterized protein YegL
MNQMSSAQKLLAYLVVDRTGVIEDRFNVIQKRWDSLQEELRSNSVTRSRVQLEVLEAFAVTARRIEPTQSFRHRLSDKSPGCDLGGALRIILNDLEKDVDAGRHSKVEVIVLLAGEPGGDWEDGVHALAQRRARVTVVAFASREEGVRDETLKKIATQVGGALRLPVFDVENAKKAFSWIGKILQESVESMDRPPTAERRAASPPPSAPATPKPTAVPPSPAAKSPAASPPQKAPATPKPVTASQPPVAGPSPASPPPEAQVAPVSPARGEGPVSAEDVVLPAGGPEPPRAESQEQPSEEAKLDLGVQEEMLPGERRAKPEKPAPPIEVVSPLEEEGVPGGAAGPEQPEAAPPVEKVVDLAEEAPVGEAAPAEAIAEPKPEPPRVTKEGVATIWEERDPTDPSDPVLHTDTRTLEAPDGWRIVGASRRGKMHAHKGIYREDAFALGEANGWHLVVVADGGGSCPLSRVGARLAADTAVNTMAHYARMSYDRTYAKNICEDALRKSVQNAWEALQNEAQARNKDMKDFGTTFLAMMHRPDEAGHIIGVLQVGDGLVAAELADGSVKALAEPDVGETAGVTLFLTSKPWKEWIDRARVITLESPLKLLAAMCDGVADDFIPFDPLLRKLFDALDEVTKHEQPALALLDGLTYEKRGSFDDRTLALIYQAQVRPDWDQEMEPEAEPGERPATFWSRLFGGRKQPVTHDSPAAATADATEGDREGQLEADVSGSLAPSIPATPEEDRGRDSDAGRNRV